MNKNKIFSLTIALIMAAALAMPVFGQSETDPTVEPTPATETSWFADNPIVKRITDLFAYLFGPAVEEPAEPIPTETPAKGGSDSSLATTPVTSSEEEAAMLQWATGIGFSDITKLLAIAAQAKAICAMEGLECDITLQALTKEFLAGASIGELFKKYGKPELNGIGHERKAADPKEKSNKGKAKGKDK